MDGQAWPFASPTEAIQSMEKIIRLIALGYRNKGVPIEDLQQEGRIGCYHAIAKYDPFRKMSFQNYAKYWIRARMVYAIITQGGVQVRLGKTLREQVRMIAKIVEQHVRIHGTFPSIEMLREELNKSEKGRSLAASPVFAEIVAGLTLRCVPIDDNLDDERPVIQIADPKPLIEDVMVRRQLEAFARTFLDVLTPVEQSIIRLRFGIDQRNGVEMTLEAIGDIFDLTKQRIQQIERRAIFKMKDAARRSRQPAPSL